MARDRLLSTRHKPAVYRVVLSTSVDCKNKNAKPSGRAIQRAAPTLRPLQFSVAWRSDRGVN